MDNSQMVVGSKDCPLQKVFLIVQQSSAIQNKWSIFAVHLDVPGAQIKKFRNDLHLDKLTLEDVIFEILEIWIARKASEATLANLLQVVEGDCGANDVGELLRLEYKLPCKRKRSDSGDNSKLTGAALISLMKGKKPHVLSLPEELSYYVSRTIVTRNIISAQIFDQDSSDIFLFTGMDRYELSTLAKKKLTGSSRQQLQGGVNVKFMIQDQESHFRRICEKTNHPVHLLMRKGDGKLRWMKSNGKMDILRKYIGQKQDEVDEDQFCQIYTTQSIPVLICDTPGMGKSVLLAQIGHRLVQIHPDRIILFIVLSKFIEFAKSLDIEDKLKVIELTLGNWTGFALQQSNLDSDGETISIELLLDGYDEVDSADRKLALEILQIIRKSFKCIRPWVTSRPHLMEELENCLNVLGYNIRPFHEENQVHFLSSFWSRKIELDQERVQQFAKRCLESLKATMKNSTDNDIAGIPLQCLLIGEVYEDDVVDYAKVKVGKEIGSVSGATIDIEIGKFTNLYSQLIKKKWEKYNSAFGNAKLKDDELMAIHAHLSLETLFPVEHGVFKFKKAAKIDMDEVVKGGILTSTRIGEVTFLHRTFAEYFVAWFIFDKLQQDDEWTLELLNLFFTIMSCSHHSIFFTYISTEMETRFTYPVICYFLDSMLSNIQLEILPSKFTFQFNNKQLEFVTRAVPDIARACIECNFVQIFKLFDKPGGLLDMLPPSVFDLDLLFLSVRKSSVELVKLILDRFERHHNFDLDVPKATLREAVKEGKFSILEFLIKEKQLGGIVENFGEDTNLVCDCVENTFISSNEEIKERIQIIQTLVGIKGSLVDGLNGSSTTAPLLSNGVHVKLRIELIQLGANVVRNEEGRTVLHLKHYASRKDYHDLVLSIPTDNLKKIINLKKADAYLDTALMKILAFFDPLPETLDIFHSVGADFNHVGWLEKSVLAFAIWNGRNAETIRKLIQLGARVDIEFFQFSRTANVLHVAAKHGNVEAVGVLLDECKIHVNSLDYDGWTPLDHAIDEILSSSYSYSELIMMLIKRGGSLKEFANFMREPLLYVVAASSLESVKLLVQLGLYKVAECEQSSLSLGDRYSIIQDLLENCSNPSPINNQKETSFHAFLRNKEGHDFKIFQLFKSKWDERSLWTPTVATLAIGYAVRDDTLSDKDLESFARECEIHGAGFNWSDIDGNSLLHLAAKNGKASTVKFLCNKGDVNCKNILGESPLHKAASSNQSTSLEIIKCLFKNRANPIITDFRKMNILHFAAEGTVDALKHFLELGGADINGKDKWGATPLHYAITFAHQSSEMNDLEKCKLLIQHGADVNMKNETGQTPMERAIEKQPKNTPLIELLCPSEGALRSLYEKHLKLIPNLT